MSLVNVSGNCESFALNRLCIGAAKTWCIFDLEAKWGDEIIFRELLIICESFARFSEAS